MNKMTYLCLGGPRNGEFYCAEGEQLVVQIPLQTPIFGPDSIISGNCPELATGIYTRVYICGLGFWIYQGMDMNRILYNLCDYLRGASWPE